MVFASVYIAKGVELTRYYFLFAAVTQFVYQTLDALDGKQARRLNKSSVLGHLFDHGCDNINTSIFITNIMLMFKVESSFEIGLLLIMSINLFNSSFINEYYTGVLNTQMANIGVTELQFITYMCNLVTFAFGT